MSEPPTTNLPRLSARLYLRLLLGPSAAMGPGKADFLAMVGEVGSIASAGWALGMSYKIAEIEGDGDLGLRHGGREGRHARVAQQGGCGCAQ